MKKDCKFVYSGSVSVKAVFAAVKKVNDTKYGSQEIQYAFELYSSDSGAGNCSAVFYGEKEMGVI